MSTFYYVVDNDWNRTNYKYLIGKVYYPLAPSYAAVKPVKVEIKTGDKIRLWGGWYRHSNIFVDDVRIGFIQVKREHKRTTTTTNTLENSCVLGSDVQWLVEYYLNSRG